jgi:uncharacterized surface protein with fasciclin (FAS1) repeats
MKARPFAVLAVMIAATSTRAADEDKTVADTLAASKDHTVLLTGVKEAGLFGALGGKGSVTLFAPTDAAFKKLGDDTLKRMVADKDFFKRLVAGHVVTGKALSAKDLAALDGRQVNGFKVSAKGGLKIGGAKVTTRGVTCGNGVMHVIDAVLVPAM